MFLTLATDIYNTTAGKFATSPGFCSPMDRFMPELFMFARTLGLEISVFLWNPFRNGKVELKKTIMSQSLRVAALRCIPHLLPISIIISMAYYNLVGFFIGEGINGATRISSSGAQLLLQIAAKATVRII
jgi:hypothetical protein